MKSIIENAAVVIPHVLSVGEKIWKGTKYAAATMGTSALGAAPFVLPGLLSKSPDPSEQPPLNVNITPDKFNGGTWGSIKNAAGSIADQAVAHPAVALGGAAAAGLGYLALKKMRDKQAKDKQNV